MSKGKYLQKEEFSPKIKAARELKNMSQQEVADIMGVSKQAVSNWEDEYKKDMPRGRAKLVKLYETLDIIKNPEKEEPHERALSLAEKALDALRGELAVRKEMRDGDINRLERDKDRLHDIIHELTATINRMPLKQG